MRGWIVGRQTLRDKQSRLGYSVRTVRNSGGKGLYEYSLESQLAIIAFLGWSPQDFGKVPMLHVRSVNAVAASLG